MTISLRGNYIFAQHAEIFDEKIISDFKKLYEKLSTPECEELVWKHLPVGPYDKFEDFLKLFKNRGKEWKTFLVYIKGEPIGTVSIIPGIKTTIEIGAVIYAPEAQNTFANLETNKLLIDWIFASTEKEKIMWSCSDDNLRSKASAEKMGFSFDRAGFMEKENGEFRATLYFELTRKVWYKNGLPRLVNKLYNNEKYPLS